MDNPPQMRNLALIGFMATGKSAVGRRVAAELHYDFVDTDALIEARHHKTISDIFAQEGETQFRLYEQEVAVELSNYRRIVIATGGGLAANEANLACLKQHALVVCLWASAEIIWSRARRVSYRPLLQGDDPVQRIRELLAVRSPFYRRADVLINTERRSVSVVARQVLHQFCLAQREVS
jgi:shikimate kinase